MAYPDNYIIYTLLFVLGGFFGLYVHHLFRDWVKLKEDQKNIKDKWKNR